MILNTKSHSLLATHPTPQGLTCTHTKTPPHCYFHDGRTVPRCGSVYKTKKAAAPAKAIPAPLSATCAAAPVKVEAGALPVVALAAVAPVGADVMVAVSLTM